MNSQIKRNGNEQNKNEKPQIPSSEAFKKPLEEGITRLDQYSKMIENYLEGSEKRIEEIEERVERIEKDELPSLKGSLDTVVGAEKKDKENISKIEDEVKRLESELNKIKDDIENKLMNKIDEIEGFINNKIENLTNKLNQEIENIDNRFRGFESRINEEIKDLKEIVKAAEDSAYNAENIAEGLKTIVTDHHQKKIDEIEEKVNNSIPPAPNLNAPDMEVPKIAKASPPPIPTQASKNNDKEKQLNEIYRRKLKIASDIATFEKEYTKENVAELGIQLKDQEKISEIEYSSIKGYNDLTTANQKRIKYYANEIKELKELNAKLNVYYDAALQLAKKYEVKEPSEKPIIETSLENLQEISNENIDQIEETTISEMNKGLDILEGKIKAIDKVVEDAEEKVKKNKNKEGGE